MGTKKKKPEEAKAVEVKLLEGTAENNKANKKEAGRVAVWINKTQIEYETELKKLQVELMKLQQDMKKQGTSEFLPFSRAVTLPARVERSNGSQPFSIPATQESLPWRLPVTGR